MSRREALARLVLERMDERLGARVEQPGSMDGHAGMPAATVGIALFEQTASTEGAIDADDRGEARLAQRALGGCGDTAPRAALRQQQIERVLRGTSEGTNQDRDRAGSRASGRRAGAPSAQRGHPTAAASGSNGTSRPNHNDRARLA